jgi:hypothetical protein
VAQLDQGRQGYQRGHIYGGGSTTGGKDGTDGITTCGTTIGGSVGTVIGWIVIDGTLIGGIVIDGTVIDGSAFGGCGPGVVLRLWQVPL